MPRTLLLLVAALSIGLLVSLQVSEAGDAGKPGADALNKAFTSSALVSRATSKTQSVSEAFNMGTRTANPFNLPLSSG